ncbi:MAG: hypothetical protein ACTHW9_07160 [Canibacter sp.]
MTLIRLQARLSRGRRRRDSAGQERTLDTQQVSRPAPVAEAVPVPWQVERDRHFRVRALTNIGAEPLRRVRLVLCGGTQLALTLPASVKPGERLQIWGDAESFAGAVTEPDAMWVVRWVDQLERELLWPFPPS